MTMFREESRGRGGSIGMTRMETSKDVKLPETAAMM
jgi:hypothetical protein